MKLSDNWGDGFSGLTVRMSRAECLSKQGTAKRSFRESSRFGTRASSPPDTPPAFTAVEEQLGLKLVPGRALLQVLVVDHVERPTED
jgi:uncharacterized protein (TIGR03435 family)